MTLEKILVEVPVKQVIGQEKVEIKDIQFDSRKAGKESVFVAIKGTQLDGHAFIDVVEAKAIVCEVLPHTRKEGTIYVLVLDSRWALARMAANFYGNPAAELKVIGVTGTNGKTSVVTLLHKLFSRMGVLAGLLSTIQNEIGDKVLPASHTTPDPMQLHALFRQMVEEGCEYCFMEVSSHALDQHRTAGVPFAVGIFTNITHDHLDYHGTFKSYIEAKKTLFDHLPKQAIALVNVDDKNGKIMVQNTAAKVKGFALKRMADYRAKILENTFEGLSLDIQGEQVWFQLMGSFNAYNLLTTFATAVELGFGAREVLLHLSAVEGVAGRFEIIRKVNPRITGIVDYSHTPDSLENILKTVSDVNQGDGKIITLAGCGGNRDKAKRPKMGHIAAKYSDRAILTSDNPRDEEPGLIIDQMYAGIPVELQAKTLRVTDREEAIKLACELANYGDIIVVAGKGHETYQEIKGVKYPFDDRKVLQKALDLRGK